MEKEFFNDDYLIKAFEYKSMVNNSRKNKLINEYNRQLKVYKVINTYNYKYINVIIKKKILGRLFGIGNNITKD